MSWTPQLPAFVGCLKRPPAHEGSRLSLVVGLLLAAAACEVATPSPGASPASAARPSVSVTTSVDEPEASGGAGTRAPDVSVVEHVVGIPPPSTDGWERIFRVGYGSEDHRLGVDRRVSRGPELAAPAVDGGWFVLDNQKRRLANYGPDGSFRGSIPIPGRFAGLQSLRILDDGRMFAFGSPALVVDADARRVPNPHLLVGLNDDGERLYAQSGDAWLEVLPFGDEVQIRYLEALTGRGDRTFELAYLPSGVRIRWIDRDPHLEVLIGYVAGASGDPYRPIQEFVVTDDGRLHLYVYGSDAEGSPTAGLLTVSPDDGDVAVVHAPWPVSDVDPGSAAHLQVDRTTGRPALVIVGNEGLDIWRLLPGGRHGTWTGSLRETSQ